MMPKGPVLTQDTEIEGAIKNFKYLMDIDVNLRIDKESYDKKLKLIKGNLNFIYIFDIQNDYKPEN